MLSDVVGSLLPIAVGVALSPVPIIAVILMLGTPRARVTGPVFTAGWVTGLATVTTLVLLVTGGPAPGEQPAFVSWLELAFGAGLLALSVGSWRSRPRAGEKASMPAWMATVDAMPTGRVALLGLLLSGVNPKNLALSFAAAAAIAGAGLSGGQDAVAVAVYVLLGSVTVAGPTLWFVVAPRRALGPLRTVKDYMAAHNAAIMAVVLLLLGAKLLGDGLADLT